MVRTGGHNYDKQMLAELLSVTNCPATSVLCKNCPANHTIKTMPVQISDKNVPAELIYKKILAQQPYYCKDCPATTLSKKKKKMPRQEYSLKTYSTLK